MEELSSLHPIAQITAIAGITVVVVITIWQIFKTIRES
jgi:hypothetical protein